MTAWPSPATLTLRIPRSHLASLTEPGDATMAQGRAFPGESKRSEIPCCPPGLSEWRRARAVPLCAPMRGLKDHCGKHEHKIVPRTVAIGRRAPDTFVGDVERMPEIAIVDDEPNILKSLRLNFRQWGYCVRTYSDPCVALPELIAEPPDVLILNGRMPGMHGLELYRRLRASSDVPVIFLSPSAEKIAAELARCGTPAAAYFDKPFWQEDLQRIVADVLGERRLPQGAVHTILDASEGGS